MLRRLVESIRAYADSVVWTRHVVIGLAAVIAAGCGGARRDFHGIEPPPPVEVGTASWYGARFAGRPTASGEIFDPALMTAAHRTLPLGSIVRVTNLENGRSVVVRVNDRGPFIHGRVLDCSDGVAQSLGFRRAGLTKVAIEWPRPETVTGDGDYWLQLGAFREAKAARRLRERANRYVDTVLLHKHEDYLRVHAGPYENREAADHALAKLRHAGLYAVVVVFDERTATLVD
jgi:rare lipoprotein A